MKNYLTFSIIICSSLIRVGLSQGTDINLNKPKFKAGDCLVWTSPTSETSSVVKIKTLHTLTLMGQTTDVYETELDDKPLSIQTRQFDVGAARKFNCANFDKVKVEVGSKNKAIKEIKELQGRPAKEAKQEIDKVNKEYDKTAREIELNFHRCNLARMKDHRRSEGEEAYKNCLARTKNDENDLRKQQQEKYERLKSKYPSLNIKFESFRIYLKD